MIEMCMQGGNDNCVRFVLEVGEFFWQKASVVVIDEGYGPHHKRTARNNRGARRLYV